MQKTALFGLVIVSVFTLSGCVENNDLTTVDDDITVEVTTGITAEQIIEEIVETPLPDNMISPSSERNNDDDDKYDDDKYKKNKSDDDDDKSDDDDDDRYKNNTYDDNKPSQPASPVVTTPVVTTTTTTTDTAVTFSLTDVAKHNIPNDCRTAVDGNVYDVSPFVSKHPGGEQNILQVCGVEATRAFVRQHGSNRKAKAALASFQIGVITQ